MKQNIWNGYKWWEDFPWLQSKQNEMKIKFSLWLQFKQNGMENKDGTFAIPVIEQNKMDSQDGILLQLELTPNTCQICKFYCYYNWNQM